MSPARLRGRVWKFGDDVCGDDGIIEFSIVREGFGKPLNEAQLKEVCFRQLNPEFPRQVRPGDLVVGGRNFAYHNHVEVSAAIKFSGIAAVVVESCESGFIRRALGFGLPVLTCPGVSSAVEDGETLEVDVANGLVYAPTGAVLHAKPFSKRMIAIWQAGGIVPLLEKEFSGRRKQRAEGDQSDLPVSGLG